MTTTTRPAVPSAEDRENAIVLLAYDPDEYGRLHEQIGDDALAYVLHSLCVEILRLRVAADTLVFIGGMINGLMFGDSNPASMENGRPADDPLRRLQVAAQQQGAAILAGAGVAPIKNIA